MKNEADAEGRTEKCFSSSEAILNHRKEGEDVGHLVK